MIKNTFNLFDIQALIIDMDGVLWLDNTPLSGLIPFFDFLYSHDIPFILATNNASKTPQQYMQKLAKFGVIIEREHVLTSSLATAAYLQHESTPGQRLMRLGKRDFVKPCKRLVLCCCLMPASPLRWL